MSAITQVTQNKGLMSLILGQLEPNDLIRAELVCRAWNASVRYFTQTTLYREIPFINQEVWSKHYNVEKLDFGNISGPSVSPAQALELLRTHHAVAQGRGLCFAIIPKGLSLTKFVELANTRKSGSPVSLNIPEHILAEHGNTEVAKATLVVATNGIFLGSVLNDDSRMAITPQQLALLTQHKCEPLNLLVALVVAVTQSIGSPVPTGLYPAWTYTFCQETIGPSNVFFGNYNDVNLIYNVASVFEGSYGVGGQRELKTISMETNNEG